LSVLADRTVSVLCGEENFRQAIVIELFIVDKNGLQPGSGVSLKVWLVAIKSATFFLWFAPAKWELC